MKNICPLPIVALISAALFLFSLAPRAFSDEAAQESSGKASEDFSSTAQNDFPALAKPATAAPSTEAGTYAPSGQAANPEPLKEDVTWSQYVNKREELRAAYDKGEISVRQYNRKVKKLKRQFRRSDERRGHGYDKHRPGDERPIDTRAIEIEKNQIDVGGNSGP